MHHLRRGAGGYCVDDGIHLAGDGALGRQVEALASIPQGEDLIKQGGSQYPVKMQPQRGCGAAGVKGVGGPAVDQGQLSGLKSESGIPQSKMHASALQIEQKEVPVTVQPGHAAVVLKGKMLVVFVAAAAGHIEKHSPGQGGGSGKKTLGCGQYAAFTIHLHEDAPPFDSIIA